MALNDMFRTRQSEQVEHLLGLRTIQTALGFSVLGFLAALFLTPFLDSGAQKVASTVLTPGAGGIDRVVTGSIERPKKTKRYIIRRSVLQSNPKEPCYIYGDGSSEGSC